VIVGEDYHEGLSIMVSAHAFANEIAAVVASTRAPTCLSMAAVKHGFALLGSELHAGDAG
jgi:hypothetical protein